VQSCVVFAIGDRLADGVLRRFREPLAKGLGLYVPSLITTNRPLRMARFLACVAQSFPLRIAKVVLSTRAGASTTRVRSSGLGDTVSATRRSPTDGSACPPTPLGAGAASASTSPAPSSPRRTPRGAGRHGDDRDVPGRGESKRSARASRALLSSAGTRGKPCSSRLFRTSERRSAGVGEVVGTGHIQARLALTVRTQSGSPDVDASTCSRYHFSNASSAVLIGPRTPGLVSEALRTESQCG
jgi:hypothetical protein